MRKKIFLLFFLLAGLAAFSLFAPDNLLSKEALVSTIVISRAEVKPPEKVFSLLDKIEEGKKLLKTSPPLKFIEKNKQLFRRETSLAILNIKTEEVFEKRYWLDEADIKSANNIRKYYLANPNNLPKFIPEDPNEDFLIINDWWNNWNSEWSVEKISSDNDEVFIVAAVKYLTTSTDLPYPEDRSGGKYSDIVYAPYSAFVHDKEIAELGKKLVKDWVNQAFKKLKDNKVESRSFPGKLVVETVDPKFVMHILINEQTDQKKLLDAPDTETRLKAAERVLVRYGLNGEATFHYTSSKTGALGPAQIMPLTYSNPKKGTGMVQAYLGANLIKDIDIGRVAMINAIMAQILVFDDHLVYVINRVNNSGARGKQIFAGLTPDQLNEVRAMIYNGGPGKYNTATGGLNLKARGALETRGFIQKLRVIRDLRLFD
ncbi:MAG: hypothetical protein Q8R55_07365 [Candidatus Taylorbacteria bacterium]|nr:hypothetical protein [Candidatus Taylorbacteria bacterium]